jgi:hypothetical protein
MSALIILGLKVPFKELWEKIGYQDRASCNCPSTMDEYTFCPYCGIRKYTKKVKMYRSRLTGEETTYRNIASLGNYLLMNKVDIYDSNPRGYTDDPVYIYLTEPLCYMEVSKTDPTFMDSFTNYTCELEELLKSIVGFDVWNQGKFGLWAFCKNTVVCSTEKQSHQKHDSNDEGSLDESRLRAFIIPLSPPLK